MQNQQQPHHPPNLEREVPTHPKNHALKRREEEDDDDEESRSSCGHNNDNDDGDDENDNRIVVTAGAKKKHRHRHHHPTTKKKPSFEMRRPTPTRKKHSYAALRTAANTAAASDAAAAAPTATDYDDGDTTDDGDDDEEDRRSNCENYDAMDDDGDEDATSAKAGTSFEAEAIIGENKDDAAPASDASAAAAAAARSIADDNHGGGAETDNNNDAENDSKNDDDNDATTELSEKEVGYEIILPTIHRRRQHPQQQPHNNAAAADVMIPSSLDQQPTQHSQQQQQRQQASSSDNKKKDPSTHQQQQQHQQLDSGLPSQQQQRLPPGHVYALRAVITSENEPTGSSATSDTSGKERIASYNTTEEKVEIEDEGDGNNNNNTHNESHFLDNRQIPRAEEERNKNESTNNSSQQLTILTPPRMITTHIVRTTESVYQQLEQATKSTVLCHPSYVERQELESRGPLATMENNNSVPPPPQFYASSDLVLDSSHLQSLPEQQPKFGIAAVSASYIYNQMMGGNHGMKTNCPILEGLEGTGEQDHDCDASNHHSMHNKRKKKKWKRFLPTKWYGYMKQCIVRPSSRKKERNDSSNNGSSKTTRTKGAIINERRNMDVKENNTNNGIILSTGANHPTTTTTKAMKFSTNNNIHNGNCSSSSTEYQPKMIIHNGIIDWDQSDLDDCHVISHTSSFVAYSTTSAALTADAAASSVSDSRKGTSRIHQGNSGVMTSVSKTTTTNNNVPMQFPSSSLGATIFGDESVIHNSIKPINEIVCIHKSLGIYVSESGLSASDCQNIIRVSEFCADKRGGWSSYTYAKQTLGCRENDQLAFVCARPVMTACATIRKHLNMGDDDDGGSSSDNNDDNDDNRSDVGGKPDGAKDDNGEVTKNNVVIGSGELSASQRRGSDNVARIDGGPCCSSKTSSSPTTSRRQELVLDVREPHVVKYDTSKMERQKLDMHTDKSEWTFLIALSEGRGQNYGGGGTYFQALNSTIHLQRGQMLIFRGKLRHCGVRIVDGTRYLLVGFLVPHVKTATPTVTLPKNEINV